MAPERISLERLASGEIKNAVMLASQGIDPGFLARLPFATISDIERLPAGAEWVIVVGGGTLMDKVKYEVRERFPGTKIVAIPSLWGSGAHVSPIVVLNGLEKRVYRNENFLPDAYVLAPELGESVSPALAKYSCGDVWSHVLEGFLSPLATSRLREEASSIICGLLDLPLGFHPEWFVMSGRACLVQAHSSVGLVHGMAHVLEPVLAEKTPGDWGHARLCTTFLYPVMSYNMSRSDKVLKLCAQYSVDLSLVLEKLKSMFEVSAYQEIIGHAMPLWNRIILDQCSRTNCVLVRREGFHFFSDFGVEYGQSQ
jgi:hypothetical protein